MRPDQRWAVVEAESLDKKLPAIATSSTAWLRYDDQSKLRQIFQRATAGRRRRQNAIAPAPSANNAIDDGSGTARICPRISPPGNAPSWIFRYQRPAFKSAT